MWQQLFITVLQRFPWENLIVRRRSETDRLEKLARLVEKTGRKEPAMYDFLQAKVFFRLTPTGMAEVQAWADPVAAAHPELR